MSSSRHSKWSSLSVLAWLPRPLLLVAIISLIQVALAQDFLNLSIPITSPQIVYTPFVCNATTALDDSQSCAGAWQLSSSSAPSSYSISTRGPSPLSGNLIPQMFFQFRAFTIFLTTLPSSNATINVTISANSDVVSATFQSSLGSISIINLPESVISLLTLTFIESSLPTQFDLDSLIITTPSNATISSFLPTPTLPPSMSFPTFSVSTSISPPLPSASRLVHVSNKVKIAQAVGITMGIGLGLTTFTTVGFYYWKRRKRPIEETRSEWRGDFRNG